MIFTRRKFAQNAALVLVSSGTKSAQSAARTPGPPDTVTLKALFAAQLPARIRVPAHVLSPGAQIYERRVYSAPVSLDVFARYGIKPAMAEGSAYLFPFASLEARQRAWDRLNADEEWVRFRAQAKLCEISLYQIENGGVEDGS